MDGDRWDAPHREPVTNERRTRPGLLAADFSDRNDTRSP